MTKVQSPASPAGAFVFGALLIVLSQKRGEEGNRIFPPAGL